MTAAPAGPGLWALVTQGAPPPGADVASMRGWAARLAGLVTPVLAAWLLADAERALGTALLDVGQVEQSRLLARLALARQHRWADAIAAEGIEAVYMKGFAAGEAIYGDAALRCQGDMDLLVREADLDRLVVFLAGRGFRFFRPEVHRWGMISDASFLPMASPDSETNIDIHVRPDCYPAHLSLTTELVFAAARRGGGRPIPAPEHEMALCVTNAANDKFDLFALRKVLDAATMLRTGAALDWDAVLRLGRDGRFLKPARVFFCLLRALGAPVAAVPPSLLRPPSRLAARGFASVVRDFETLFATRPSMLELLWREATLCAEPGIALHNAGLRLRGLLRPHSGLPAGVPAAAAPSAQRVM
jgi:hypothetical protein